MNVKPCYPVSLTLLAALACGPVEFAEPTAPTPSQESASEALADIATMSALAVTADIEPARLVEVHDRLASLSETALLEGFQSLPEDGRSTLLDPSCVRSGVDGGFDFDGCPVSGGELVGQILVEGGGLDFELTLPPPQALPTTSRIDGELTFVQGRLTGELTFRTGDDGVEDPQCGCLVGGSGPHVKTRTVWDVQVDAATRCLSNGSVEVQVVAFGGEDAVRFEFGECGVVAVRNEVD